MENRKFRFETLKELIDQDELHLDGSLCINNIPDEITLKNQLSALDPSHRASTYMDDCGENRIISYYNSLDFKKSFVINYEETGTLGLTLIANE